MPDVDPEVGSRDADRACVDAVRGDEHHGAEEVALVLAALGGNHLEAAEQHGRGQSVILRPTAAEQLNEHTERLTIVAGGRRFPNLPGLKQTEMFGREGADAAQQKLRVQHPACYGALVSSLVVEKVHPLGNTRLVLVGIQQVRRFGRKGHSRWCGRAVRGRRRVGTKVRARYRLVGATPRDPRMENVPSGHRQIASYGGVFAAAAIASVAVALVVIVIIEADTFSFLLWRRGRSDDGAPGGLGDEIEGATLQLQPLTIGAHGLLLVAAGMARFAGKAKKPG